VLDGPQYAVTSSHPWAIHSSRVELIFSVSTHVHLCSWVASTKVVYESGRELRAGVS
jgi:hypothetical protein